MKALKTAWACAALLTTGMTQAQAQEEAQTLFGSIESQGFMVAPSFAASTFDEAGASLFDLRGGLVLNDLFTLGGFYQLSLNEMVPASEALPNIYLDYRAGGLLLEFTPWSGRLVHLSVPVAIGACELEMDSEYLDALALGEANTWVAQPGLLLELNLHKFARLNLGASYRLVGDVVYRGLGQEQVNGLVGQVGLKFGWFRAR